PTEQFITALVEHLVGAPLLLLLTYRPGYRPPWIDKSYATQLTLPPLTPPDSLSVVQTWLPAQSLPDVLVQVPTKGGRKSCGFGHWAVTFGHHLCDRFRRPL